LVVLAKMILPKKNVERRASRFESLLTSYPLPVTFPSALMILLTTNHTNLHE
jgi:ABC-type anion transport system duplicated permease subunit